MNLYSAESWSISTALCVLSGNAEISSSSTVVGNDHCWAPGHGDCPVVNSRPSDLDACWFTFYCCYYLTYGMELRSECSGRTIILMMMMIVATVNCFIPERIHEWQRDVFRETYFTCNCCRISNAAAVCYLLVVMRVCIVDMLLDMDRQFVVTVTVDGSVSRGVRLPQEGLAVLYSLHRRTLFIHSSTRCINSSVSRADGHLRSRGSSSPPLSL